MSENNNLMSSLPLELSITHNIEEKVPTPDLCNHIKEASGHICVAWSPVLNAWTIVNMLANKVIAVYDKGFCPKCGALIGEQYVSGERET